MSKTTTEWSMQHWNGHQVCAVDSETTGLDPFFHELIQVAVLALDANFVPRKDVPPFYVNITPAYPERIDPEAIKINKINLNNLLSHGLEIEASKDLFIDWVNKLGLPQTPGGYPKHIIPLGQNYKFDYPFLIKWLGYDLYNEVFWYHYKDTMLVAEALNDHAAIHAETVPFAKTNLSYLANELGIPHTKAHDALQDCIVTAEVYRRMMQRGLFGG